MKMDLDSVAFEKQIGDLNDQWLRVFVNPNQMARKADLRKNGNSGPKLAGLKSNPTIMRNIVDKRSGIKKPKIKLEELAAILDKRRTNGGLFSQAMRHAENVDLNTIIDGFADKDRSDRTIQKMENAGRSIVRNQIIGKRLGSNTIKRQIQKGFNRFGMSTGSLFNYIEATYNGK